MTNFCTPLHRTLSARFKCERETYSGGTASSQTRQATWHVRKHPHKWANIQKHLISVSYISIVSLSRCNARCLIQITQRQRKTSKQHVNLANEEKKKELPWMQPRCAAVSFWRLVLIPAGIFSVCVLKPLQSTHARLSVLRRLLEGYLPLLWSPAADYMQTYQKANAPRPAGRGPSPPASNVRVF